MVPRTTGTIDRVSPSSTSGPSTSDGSIQQTSSPDVNRVTPASCLEAIRSRQEFQKRLLSCWQLKGLMIPTRVPGSNGMAGVLNGVWPFRAL